MNNIQKSLEEHRKIKQPHIQDDYKLRSQIRPYKEQEIKYRLRMYKFLQQIRRGQIEAFKGY